MNQRFFTCLLVILMCPVVAYGQVEVEGTVTDEASGDPLVGVNVVVTGTTTGAVTDQDGQYSLTASSPQDSLTFSYVGYGDRTVPIDGRSTVNIALQPATLEGEEVVVVGYGTQQQENLTGSVASVGSDEIETIAAPNTSSLLQGRMSGVQVSNFTPQPGRDDANIRIRGMGTFNAGQNPLIVIDGVTSSVSALGQIPPSDISDVTVLKDAASAAIYGARAANGVILVETKQGGQQQEPTVTFRSTFTRQTPLIDMDLLDSWEYAEVVNQNAIANGSEPIYTEEMIQTMEEGSAPDRFANTDWYSEVVNPSNMHEYYMSVSGGGENSTYLISSAYKDQNGIMLGTGSDQINLRSNLSVDVADESQIGINLYGYRETIEEPSMAAASGGGDNSVPYMVRRFAKPTVPVKYSNGHWGSVDGLYPDYGIPVMNPVRNVSEGETEENQYHLTAKLFGNFSVTDNLRIRSRVSSEFNSSTWSSFSPTTTTYGYNGNEIQSNPINSLTESENKSYKVSNENTINYSYRIDSHSFELLGGQSIEYYHQDWFEAHAEEFPNNNVRELTAGVSNVDVDGTSQSWGLFSLFGRLNYDYEGRYLFEANLRYDGSSRLPESNRFSAFPSFSLGWVPSNESFMEDIDAVSMLKLRGSWGQLGNQEIGNYPYVQTYSTGQDYIVGDELQGGAAITNLANTSIAWETTRVTNVGVDLDLFGDQLQITANYFDKTTNDILLELPIPENVGNASPPFQNVGSVQNRGWELSVDYRQSLTSDLSVNGGFNVTRTKNEVKDLGELGENDLGGWITGNSVNAEGHPIGAYYGYVAEGYFQNEEEVENHATQWDARPGDIKYRDLNDDGEITPDDRKVIGTPFPDYSFGINLGAQFKGISITSFFQGLYGIRRFNWYNNEFTERSNFTDTIKDRWSENNPNARFPRFGNNANNNPTSSFWLRNASYLRLKQLEIGYSFPQGMLQQFNVERLRIYASGYNLFTITPMVDFDPERSTNDNRNQGYPQMENYAVGVTLEF